MFSNWIVKSLGTLFLVAGLLVGLLSSDASLYGWLAFVGGCVLFSAAHVVEFLNDRLKH